MSLLNLFMITCVCCLFSYIIKELHYSISLEIVELHNYIRQTRGPVLKNAMQFGLEQTSEVRWFQNFNIFEKLQKISVE